MIRIIPPHHNLGCLGFRIKGVYIDFFRRPYFGTFSSTLRFGKVWIRLFPKPELVKREWIEDGEYHYYKNGKQYY